MDEDPTDNFEKEVRKTVRDATTRGRRNAPVDSGDLASDVSKDLKRFQVYNTLEYAPRINWGFTGVDSLGREYDQNGTFYLEDAALDAFEDSIVRIMSSQ